MKTVNAIKTGLLRSVKAWKGVLIAWLFYSLFVVVLAIPLRSSIRSGFGNSMITERFADGFNLEAFSDLENVGRSLISSLSSGLLLALVIGIILNAFLSGGLFASLKDKAGRLTPSGFFAASGKYFLKFLFITFILSIIALLLGFFIIFTPAGLVMQSEPDLEKLSLIIGIVSGFLYFIILSIIVLVADYARAWNVGREQPLCFRAIGFGIKRTFERFRSSFMVVLFIMLVQGILTFLVYEFIGMWRPDSGWGVFLLFMISQLFFIMRLLIKTWRYGAVTNLMELIDKSSQEEKTINL